jgi:hypothetical protein
VNVTYSLHFEELQALTAMGLTWEEYNALPGTPDWIDPANPTLSKCDVLAWYRLSGRVGAVMSAAAAKKAKR